jgi:hypothetical protein
MFNHNSRNYNGYILNPTNGIVYLYNNAAGGDFKYEEPVMDGRRWADTWNKVASEQDDMTAISDIFYDTRVPGEDYTYTELVTGIHDKLNYAKKAKDENRIAAVITSKDYEAFQIPALVTTTSSTIRTGILGSLFEEIATPQLSVRYGNESDSLVWHTFVPEGTTVDPSKGSAGYTDIFVSKHEGAVAETFRTKMVLAGMDPLAKLTQRLALKRLQKENIMVAAEIQSNTASPTTGVDFGARTGLNSTTEPSALWGTLITLFESFNKGTFNTIISKGFIYNEYILNDKVRGVNVPLPDQSSTNEKKYAVPGLSGVQWATDNAITSSTAMWVCDRDLAIKNFRGPTTAFTVESQERETTKNVIRTYYQVETVDTQMINMVTGVAA